MANFFIIFWNALLVYATDRSKLTRNNFYFKWLGELKRKHNQSLFIKIDCLPSFISIQQTMNDRVTALKNFFLSPAHTTCLRRLRSMIHTAQRETN